MHTTTLSNHLPIMSLYAVLRTDTAMAGAATEPISAIQARAIAERMANWTKQEYPQTTGHHWIVANRLYQLDALMDCQAAGHRRLQRHLGSILELERWHVANRVLPVANTAAGPVPDIYQVVPPADPRARYFALPIFLWHPHPETFLQPVWLPGNHSLAGQLAHILHIDPQLLRVIAVVPGQELLEPDTALTEVVLTDAIAQAYRNHARTAMRYRSTTIHLWPEGGTLEAHGDEGPEQVCLRAFRRAGVPMLGGQRKGSQPLKQRSHTTGTHAGHINGTPQVNSVPAVHMAIQ